MFGSKRVHIETDRAACSGTKVSPLPKTENDPFCRSLRDCACKISTVYFLYRLPLPADRRWSNCSALRQGSGHPAVFFRSLLFQRQRSTNRQYTYFSDWVTGSSAFVAQSHLKNKFARMVQKGYYVRVPLAGNMHHIKRMGYSLGVGPPHYLLGLAPSKNKFASMDQKGCILRSKALPQRSSSASSRCNNTSTEMVR